MNPAVLSAQLLRQWHSAVQTTRETRPEVQRLGKRLQEESRWKKAIFGVLPPEHQVLHPADAREVVVNDSDHQHQQQNEPSEEHALFDSHAEVPACDALERKDQNVPPVEDGNRQ